MRRATAAASRRTDVHSLVEPHIHVVDVRHGLPERRHDFQVGSEPRNEPFGAEMDADRIPVQQHDRVMRIGDVHLRDACSKLSVRIHLRHQTCSKRRTARVDRRAAFAPRADSPSMIGKSRSENRGPNSSMTCPVTSTR